MTDEKADAIFLLCAGTLWIAACIFVTVCAGNL